MKAMKAKTALSRARQTLNCPKRRVCWSHYLAQETAIAGMINHDWSASALLDGFSVGQIRRAGG